MEQGPDRSSAARLAPRRGCGRIRSMFDIVTGFSLTFSILTAGLGLLGLLVRRHDGRSPGLVRQASIAYPGIFGIMTGIAFRYWFPGRSGRPESALTPPESALRIARNHRSRWSGMSRARSPALTLCRTFGSARLSDAW